VSVLDARAPARAPGTELLGEFAGSGHQDAPSLVRRGDGQTVQVTPLLYQLLELLDGERDLVQLADELGARCGKAVTPENVRFLLEEKLTPLGLIGGADGSAPVMEKPSPLLGLKFKFVVSDPAVTRRITAPFAWLFRPWVVLPVLVAFAVTCWWVLWKHGLAAATRQAFDSPGLLLAVFGLTVLSAGWHEFGHAAACRSAGATPGAMGGGLYLVWPAFYTDVDDSYRLSRWGRLVVDLGGLYFNAIVAVAVAGAWIATRRDALLLVVATQLLLMLRQLAPVIRADGYHILADLTGVPDLFQHIKPTLAGLLPTNWGKPQPLRPWSRWVVRAWVLIVVPLLIWMFLGALLLFPRLVATAWTGLQKQGSAFLAGGRDGDVLGVLAAALQTLALVLPVAAVTYQLVRLGRRVARKVWARTEGRPAARRAVVVGAAALLAVLAWAWWPSGQYEPVRADEGGTLQQAVHVRSVRANPVSSRASRPIAGVQPRTAYALVPRGGKGTTLLLVKADDGTLRSILTEGDRTGVAFPFQLPDAPGAGDNQALAVNTGDGTVVYDVAVALVWVKDGEVADNRNEAYALASCSDCTTVAVAFQVVLVIGQSDAITPVNAAVAANGGCLRCVTTALAIQLVVTLREMPSEEVQAKIQAALARLDGLERMDDPYAQVKAVEAEILTILVDSGLVERQETTAATSGATPTTTVAGDPAASTSTTTAGTSPTTAASTSTTAPTRTTTTQAATEDSTTPSTSASETTPTTAETTATTGSTATTAP
jgi:putative peptide zinc metalloprotease protein